MAVRALLNQRGDDWREGVAAAFLHFGGVPLAVLGDNARPLVQEHDRQAGTVRFHPAWVEFCRDWDVTPKACGPYRARTKGKTESGVKYVKRNALAGREFESFGALEAHLVEWMSQADERVHGTTHERPLDRFEREEKAALRPLPSRPLPARQQRLRRKVANDALVDVDTAGCCTTATPCSSRATATGCGRSARPGWWDEACRSPPAQQQTPGPEPRKAPPLALA